MTFEEYLIDKKIDSDLFKNGDPALWTEFKSQFATMHPKSFTAQKLYLINGIRRKYHLVETPNVPNGDNSDKPKAQAKPVINTKKPVMAKPVIRRPKI